MAEIGADGINGDTQDGVPLAFSLAADKIGHPLVFEPEGGPSDEALAWNVMTWGQYQFPFAPLVDKYKWLEPRHMVNISDRWNRDKTGDLQFAFFNGVGWESWENIWGIWNGITPRDAEATRRVATIERAFAPFLISRDWEPMYPMLRYGVFASRWPLGDQTLWTIVNRNEYDVDGDQIEVPASAGDALLRSLSRSRTQAAVRETDASCSAFRSKPKGYGAVLATNAEPDAALQSLLSKMKQMTSTTARQLLARMEGSAAGNRQDQADRPCHQRARRHGEDSRREFSVRSLRASKSKAPTTWESTCNIRGRIRRDAFTGTRSTFDSFYIDQYPVTNAEFKKFLDATHYHPQDDLNFLRDWKNGTYPAGWENRPVTWVSLEDARAYADWAGKRLPHEWEWQYAAQGTDGRLYPWGNEWDASAVPVPDKSRTMRGPDPVDAHPKGASPFGVMDMVGNVWQWTDEFADEHTRAAILRGGSYYQPQGSIWYFPQAYRLNEHGKLLLMSPSMDRSGAVGFRCVRDANRTLPRKPRN